MHAFLKLTSAMRNTNSLVDDLNWGHPVSFSTKIAITWPSHIYIYIYIYACTKKSGNLLKAPRIYIYIYIYICVCVCVCVCVWCLQ